MYILCMNYLCMDILHMPMMYNNAQKKEGRISGTFAIAGWWLIWFYMYRRSNRVIK